MSYSHADWDWCKPFAQALSDDGFSVWYDERIGVSQPWVVALEQQVQSCEFFLLVLTPEAWASEWVQREFQLALVTKRRILPVKLKETSISGFLLTLQWVTVHGLDPDAAAELVKNVLWKPEPLPPDEITSALTVVKPRPATAPDVPSGPFEPTQAVTPTSLDTVLQPKLFLWSIGGSMPPQVVTIPGNRLTLGREFDNDLVLPDPAISRHHALLTGEVTDDAHQRWTLRTQAGAAPVSVNGHLCTEVVLQPFDQIVLGTTVMRFELSGKQQRQTLTETSIHYPLLMIDCPLCHFVAPLRDPSIVLGRAPECGLIIPSPIVSRKHAQLQRASDGGYTITPLNGTNPLLCQGQPVQQRRLLNGDTLTIDAQVPGLAVIMRYSTLAL
jgi:hypothetical protein